MTSQQFAEYYHNSPPELSPRGYEAGPIKPEGGQDYQHENAGPSNETKDRRKCLGLAPWAALVIVLVALIVITGIVVGAVVGTRHKSQGSHAATTTTTQTTTQTTSSTTSTTASATPTGFTIIEAVYADKKVTDEAKEAMPQPPNLVIDLRISNAANNPWSNPDPWYGVTKCFSLLHELGTSIRTFVACDGDGPFTLVPGDVDKSPKTEEITQYGPSNSHFAIVSVVWGSQEIRDKAVYENIYQYKQNGSEVPFTNDFFGSDTLYGTSKTGIIWYTEDNFQTFNSIISREGISVSF